MGTHISKVKSVDLDVWTPEQMAVGPISCFSSSSSSSLSLGMAGRERTVIIALRHRISARQRVKPDEDVIPCSLSSHVKGSGNSGSRNQDPDGKIPIPLIASPRDSYAQLNQYYKKVEQTNTLLTKASVSAATAGFRPLLSAAMTAVTWAAAR